MNLDQEAMKQNRFGGRQQSLAQKIPSDSLLMNSQRISQSDAHKIEKPGTLASKFGVRHISTPSEWLAPSEPTDF